jgi:hypothetical protein
MRKVLLTLVAMSMLLVAAPASAAGGGTTLSDRPWSAGVLIGASVSARSGFSYAQFALELPVEYTFKVGPGELAAHFGFLLGAGQHGVVSIGLPLGVRYKFNVWKQLYVYPLFDIGPGFVMVSNTTTVGGLLRVGGGLSYLVHPMVELMLQPLGLGATFDANGGAFLYNFLVGAQFRF